ncbi:ribbon-helix-helix protein, CopG family [Halalkalicoccus sp. NIPERK01]|uniref:ribbon-helix-helix protein, CopG family n=1 Tax=Halalkalicoccus sp. NIPERK01 TaxID=3053469 RepID=UPI00256F25E6|nr:ribbon-helix-helix protein, CopG family [Halalkalicoccus sp. NIPERK01]MDL5361559.1 ribbon-helix-helix protein, CopG family [Halalkalicoccus sp. NIPERK01]
MTDRVTVSLDAESRAALDTLVSETGDGQSAAVRRALTFYAANLEAAETDVSADLQQYHRLLSTGEHVLLDVDFLHCFLEYVYREGEPDPEFQSAADRVADFHAAEYAERFSDLSDVLEWLSLCGFLSVRGVEDGTYHVVFPSEPTKRFMLRFVERSTADLPFEVDVEEGVAKALLTRRERSG